MDVNYVPTIFKHRTTIDQQMQCKVQACRAVKRSLIRNSGVPSKKYKQNDMNCTKELNPVTSSEHVCSGSNDEHDGACSTNDDIDETNDDNSCTSDVEHAHCIDPEAGNSTEIFCDGAGNNVVDNTGTLENIIDINDDVDVRDNPGTLEDIDGICEELDSNVDLNFDELNYDECFDGSDNSQSEVGGDIDGLRVQLCQSEYEVCELQLDNEQLKLRNSELEERVATLSVYCQMQSLDSQYLRQACELSQQNAAELSQYCSAHIHTLLTV